jgi:hypothetical protein
VIQIAGRDWNASQRGQVLTAEVTRTTEVAHVVDLSVVEFFINGRQYLATRVYRAEEIVWARPSLPAVKAPC